MEYISVINNHIYEGKNAIVNSAWVCIKLDFGICGCIQTYYFNVISPVAPLEMLLREMSQIGNLTSNEW